MGECASLDRLPYPRREPARRLCILCTATPLSLRTPRTMRNERDPSARPADGRTEVSLSFFVSPYRHRANRTNPINSRPVRVVAIHADRKGAPWIAMGVRPSRPARGRDCRGLPTDRPTGLPMHGHPSAEALMTYVRLRRCRQSSYAQSHCRLSVVGEMLDIAGKQTAWRAARGHVAGLLPINTD